MAAPSISETLSNTKTRRRTPRQRIENLVYAYLGPENGGFPIDLSEEGVAFQGIRPLQIDQTVCIAFKLDDFEEMIAATAKIVWLTDTRKGGGLQFVSMTDSTRQLIQQWISQRNGASFPDQSPAALLQDETSGTPVSGVIPFTIDSGNPTAQTPTKIALTVPAASAPMQNAPSATSQASKEEIAPKAGMDLQKSEAKKAAADFQPLPRVPTFLGVDEKKSLGKRFHALTIAASTAAILVSGSILWPLRGNLVRYAMGDKPTPVAAISAKAASAEFAASDSAILESLQMAPIANAREILNEMPPRKGAFSAPPQPVAKPTPAPVPPKNQAIFSKTPTPPDVVAHPVVPAAAPAPMPAPRQMAIAAAPSPIPQPPAVPPIPAPVAGNLSSPAERPPEPPMTAAGSIEIISDPYPTIRVPEDWKGRPARPGASFRIGHLISKVEPIYPQDALRQRITGRVKLHVIIGRDGAVESAKVLEGAGMLTEPALHAVHQWRYEATLLGGEAIEIEQDITVAFRMASPASR